MSDHEGVKEDPISFFSRLSTKLNTLWMGMTYPFASFGNGISIHHSCQISRAMSSYISMGNEVYLAPDVWLNIAHGSEGSDPRIILSKGCKIGRRSTISAKNQILLGDDVLLAPSVLIMDHNHEYKNPDMPIHAQGVTEGGKISIGRNCWLGYNSVIFCGTGELTLGENSVVGANSVVTRSFPPLSVIAGSPATLIKTYDRAFRRWIRVGERDSKESFSRSSDANRSR